MQLRVHLGRRMAVGLGALLLSASTASAAPPLPPGLAFYSELSGAAARGDTGAQQVKTAVDTYLARHHLSPADLGQPTRSTRIEKAGAVHLRIVGSPPWSIHVINDTELATSAALTSYRLDRHGALASLAAADPNRRVRVVIAPRNQYDLSEFAPNLACDCRGVSIVVDVFSDAGWLMSSGRPLSGEDVASQAKQLEADLLSQAAGSLDQFTKADQVGVHLTVRRIEVDVPAGQALAIAGRADVLTVDPLTDLQDAYKDAAAVVDVGPGPDTFYAYAQFNLGNPFMAAVNPVKEPAK